MAACGGVAQTLGGERQNRSGWRYAAERGQRQDAKSRPWGGIAKSVDMPQRNTANKRKKRERQHHPGGRQGKFRRGTPHDAGDAVIHTKGATQQKRQAKAGKLSQHREASSFASKGAHRAKRGRDP